MFSPNVPGFQPAQQPSHSEMVEKYLAYCKEYDVTPAPIGSDEFEEDFRFWLSLLSSNGEES
ncbi:MAG: hypothetical protein KBC06_02420 [Candidatus Pacebacteria bacterium]|nr:hypothetical protein [Candidatus Paceibacterota bacterium]